MLNLLAVALVDAGIAGVIVGFVSVIKPLGFLGVRTRNKGGAIFSASIALIFAGTLVPAPLEQAVEARSDLDRAMPAWQFDEHHSVTVHAPRERIHRAIRETTAGDIGFFQTLVWIRRFGRPGPENILNAPAHRPLLDVATRTTFTTLSDTPQEIVVGTVVVAPREAAHRVRHPTAEEFLALRAQPGFALATMSFAIGRCAAGACEVTTDTRVFATSEAARRRFGAYWRLIYPGSALIRRMWLRAIARRAEAV